MMAAHRPVAALTCILLGVACAANADPPAPAAAPVNAPAAPAPVDSRPLGQQLYGRHCLSCHQADGGGVPNMQPAIAGGSWVQGDARALALFVMTGGFGSAERKESSVDNVMPAFRQLTDDELAQILTYVRAKFGNGASAVSAAQVAEARATLP
jgi:mono/diheme cytochrome c family protein